MNILIGNDINEIKVITDPGLLADYEFKQIYIEITNSIKFGLCIFIKSIKIASIACYQIYKSGSTYYVQSFYQRCINGCVCTSTSGNRIYLNDDAMADYKSALKKVKEELDQTIKRMESEGETVNISNYRD